METKLESLIEKLKKEGVDEAKKIGEKMMADARRESEQQIGEARAKAEEILSTAARKADLLQKNAESAIRQAARDAELALKDRLMGTLDNVFRHEVSRTLSPDVMKTLILEIVSRWKPGKELDVRLNKTDLKKLENALFSGVHAKLKETIHLQGTEEDSGGFRIGIKGENVYYDFSADTISEFLKSSLNPRIREILEERHG